MQKSRLPATFSLNLFMSIEDCIPLANSDLTTTDALKGICNRLVLKYPDAVGMAAVELDCGCVDICGVSIRGEPVGAIKTIALGAETGEQQGPICSRCLAEKGRVSDRIVNRRIIWPGSDEERPDAHLRRFIGRTVFGADYTE